MKKKGFTLVELIAVIAILGVVLVMFVPNILKNMDARRNESLNRIYELIETAARNYAIDYSIKDPHKIEISELCGVYMDCPVINPVTEEELNECVKMLNKDGGYSYIYGSCDSVSVPLTVELNGGSPGQEFNSTYNEFTKITLIDPTRENFEFKEWQVVKGNSSINGNTLIIGTTETILWAIWDSYPKLIVDLDGGSDNKDYNEMYKSGTVIHLEEPVKEGVIFEGWEVVEGNGVVSGNTLTMGSSDTTVKAKWKSFVNTTYKVNHHQMNLDGATYTIYETEEFNELSETVVTPQVKLYIGFTAPSTQTKSVLADGSLVIDYYYTRNSYIFSLGSKTGVTTTGSSTTGNYMYGETITLIASANAGYTWSKWTSSNTTLVSNKSATEATFTMPAGDLMMTPDVYLTTYTISYVLNGGTNGTNAPTSGAYGSIVTVSDPTRSGYSFTGWTVSGTGALLSGTNLTIGAGNVTLTANWKVATPIGAYSCANSSAGSSYFFTYTGNCTVIDDGNGNWRVKFLTSGTFKSTTNLSIDVFLVGGGGSGYRRAGGGGGYTTTKKKISVTTNTQYSITIGAGGSGGSGGDGGASIAFSATANGGKKPSTNSSGRAVGGAGGSGGGGRSDNGGNGGSGGSNGGNGGASYTAGGSGQGTTTREFGESSGTLYAGGGGGGASGKGTGGSGGAGGGGNGANSDGSVGGSGTANTGGGGGGSDDSASSASKGGSGIVVIRNTR